MRVGFRVLALFLGIAGVGTSASFAQSGWFWQNPLPQGNTLRAIAAVDANTGTAVGLYGTILRTTDGGATWTRQSSGTASNLYSVSFTNANTGTAGLIRFGGQVDKRCTAALCQGCEYMTVAPRRFGSDRKF